MDKEVAKQNIQKLIDKYEVIKKTGKLKTYSEEDTIQGFILPLLEILGWDTKNKEEVSSQDHIKGSGYPDHTLKINGITQFYLESKKFSADLDNEVFSRQVVNYSWNTGVTYAVLTDFESIKIFNAQRIEKVDLMDKLVFELSYDKYISDFETLWYLSKEAFRKKALDEYAEKHGKKEKSVRVATVIKKINEDIQDCREWLTKEFRNWNDKLNISKDVIDEGVQKLLDRLIFLRVAEDREVEPNILKTLLREAEKSKTYMPFQEMSIIFRELDKIYDSNLFSPHPFESWEIVDNKGFENMVNKLYGKRGQYEYNFKEMPADVLGTVYENYLNYKLTQSKKGVNVEKDVKKRKEQGIFYTPIFVVDYIVKHALKPVLDKCRSIDDLKKIRVLDPACGSGSFLIRALEAIEEKYKEFGVGGSIKRQIILENIFGVDLDMQAVEIARLNLLINSLDSKEVLPKLDNNIKNGNSLLFNWKEEFRDVFRQGGFDVIIGNPPYIKEFVNKDAFKDLHDSPYYQGKMDIWTMFACISIDLLKEDGVMSFIAPNNWVTNAGASIMRNKILSDGELKSFVDFGDYKVFQAAGIQTMIFIYEKRKPNKKYEIDYLRINNKDASEEKLILDIFGEKQKIEIEPEKLINKNIIFADQESGSIFDKIENKKNFELTEKEVGQGIVAAPDKYFLEKTIVGYDENEQKFLKPFFTASGRYKSGESENFIFYISDKNFKGKNLNDYPNIESHFKPFEKTLTKAKGKYGTPNKPYFYLHREREEVFFRKGPKIVCGVRVTFPSFFYTEEQYYGSRALNFINTDRIGLKYLAGILNSKLSFFWLKNKGKQLGDLLQIDKGPLLEIPICIGNKDQQKEITTLVDEITSLNKKLGELLENSNEWENIKSEIEKLDKKIDGKIYDLYGLSENEIKIIESDKK